MADDGLIPVDKQIVFHPNDWADYLDGEDPRYADGLSGDALAEFDAAEKERRKEFAAAPGEGSKRTKARNRRRRKKPSSSS